MDGRPRLRTVWVSYSDVGPMLLWEAGRGWTDAPGLGQATKVLTEAVSSARPFLASAKNIEVFGLV